MSPDAAASPELLPLVAAGLLVLVAAGWLAFRRGAEGRWRSETPDGDTTDATSPVSTP